jgi:hypothetical protein
LDDESDKNGIFDTMMDVSHVSAIEAAICHNDELPDDTKRVVRLILRRNQRQLASLNAEINHASLIPAALLAR